MRCVMITPLGMPLEPEVKITLAIESGRTCSQARRVASSGACASKASKGVLARRCEARRECTTSTPGGTQRSSAVSKAAASSTNTSPGLSRSSTCRSFWWSSESRE